jgi:hypothetical protein
MTVIQNLEMEECLSEFKLDVVGRVTLQLICNVEYFLIGAADLET